MAGLYARVNKFDAMRRPLWEVWKLEDSVGCVHRHGIRAPKLDRIALYEVLLPSLFGWYIRSVVLRETRVFAILKDNEKSCECGINYAHRRSPSEASMWRSKAGNH
jgi:hypothetical protein